MRPDHMQRARLLAPLIFALLALATVVAFGVAQRLKHHPLILDQVMIHPLHHGGTVISPNGDAYADRARITFRLTRSDRGVVQIVNSDDVGVRTLIVREVSRRNRLLKVLPPGSRLPSFKHLSVRWDGRDGSGRLVPTGPYRLRVRLLGEGRTLIPGGRIRVHEFSLHTTARRGR